VCPRHLKELTIKFQQIKYLTKLILHNLKILESQTKNQVVLDKRYSKDKNP
jgi:hypothetical protein